MKKYKYTIYLKNWFGVSNRIIDFDSLSFCKKIFIPHLFIPPFTTLLYIVKSPIDSNSKKKPRIVYQKKIKTNLLDLDSRPVCNCSELRSVFDYEK